MIVEQTSYFAKAFKKLHANQCAAVQSGIGDIIKNPAIGEMKKGDLVGVRVYKFRMVNQLALLAYTLSKDLLTLRLLALGSHENFYRDLKTIH